MILKTPLFQKKQKPQKYCSSMETAQNDSRQTHGLPMYLSVIWACAMKRKTEGSPEPSTKPAKMAKTMVEKEKKYDRQLR